MKIYEWEIWHTYTSFVGTSDIDLEYLAHHLIESEMAYLTFHRDGLTVWRGDSGVGKGISTVTLGPDGRFGKFKLDPQEHAPNISDFAKEAWWQACYFRFGELRLFGTEMPLPHSYVRAYLGQCDLVMDDQPHPIRIYPTLVVYESGIIIVEFRTISPCDEISHADFIDGAVNLFQLPFDQIRVPPALSKLATRAWYHSKSNWKFHQRAAMIFLERRHDLAVSQLTSVSEAGDFVFDLAPLGKSDDPETYEQLSSLALTIFHTLAFLMARPRKGWSFLFRGQQQIPEICRYWSGRPHIHLTKFQDQRDTAKENEEAHGSVFGTLMLRSSCDDLSVARSHLPPDSRLFQDYSAYISSALSLWVWSLNGLRRQEEWTDPNRGHLIYEHQAIVELLEYGYMLHRALLEQIKTLSQTDEVLVARQGLMELEQEMADSSHFGEIRDLLENGWKAMGLDAVKKRIRDSLEIMEAKTSMEESRVTGKIVRALTILFGLIAVPPIAEQVLKPLWKILELPRPKTDDGFSILLILLSFLLVALIVLLLLRNLDRNK